MRLVQIMMIVSLLAVVVATSASATTIRTGSTTGPLYSGSITATNNGNVILATSSGFGTITCTDSTLAGTVTSSGSTTISTASWSNGGGNCTNNMGQSCSVTAQNLSWTGAIAYSGGTSDGTMTLAGSPYIGYRYVCGATTCFYGNAAWTLDFSNPTSTTGSRLTINATVAKQTGSTFACSSSATISFTYSVTTSSGSADLYVTP